MARLGEFIKSKIQKDNISYRKFAEKCDLSDTYIKNLVEGDPRTGKPVSPTIDTMDKIAGALGLSLEDLLKETGHISERKKFEPSNLKLIRGNKTFEQLTEDIAAKTGQEIDPMLYKAIEEGSTSPSLLFLNALACYTGIEVSFFYTRNATSNLEQAKTDIPYKYPDKDKDIPIYIKDEKLKVFINKPEAEEYIRLAKDLYDRDIKVKLIRSLLFNE